MSRKLPPTLLVYQCDTVDDQPVYAVALDADEIGEEFHGQQVGVYKISSQRKLKVSKELAS